jgi:hypothetical protein
MLWSFVDDIVVACPRCGRMAQVVRRPGAPEVQSRLFGERRLTCTHCGYARDHAGRCASFPSNRQSSVRDPFFGAPLWLQLPTRHGVLWAYNLVHLALIERFVAAHIRERASNPDTGRKMTLVATLPAWLKRASNRAENLRNIARLQESAWSVRRIRQKGRPPSGG